MGNLINKQNDRNKKTKSVHGNKKNKKIKSMNEKKKTNLNNRSSVKVKKTANISSKDRKKKDDTYITTIFSGISPNIADFTIDASKVRNSIVVSNSINRKFEKNSKHLICDDAHTNRLVLKKYLTFYNCEVDEAENGQNAIQKVQDNGQYIIIWMDIKMPKMNGHECTYFLRSEMNYKGTIIGLTGYVDEDTIKKCLELGMNHVVPKPFDKNTIKMYIDKYH